MSKVVRPIFGYEEALSLSPAVNKATPTAGSPEHTAAGHADDRCVQFMPSFRSLELGRPKAEDATVTCHLPVPEPVRGARHTHHGRVQPHTTHRTGKLRVAETEDPAVGGDQPVPPAVDGSGHPHHRRVEGVPPMEP